MNPAALGAMLDGNLENFLAAATPGGIERQEAQGQRDLARAADRLPSDMSPECKSALESLGFIFGDPVDDIFISVQMPSGWSIRPTEHSMHSDLVDPQGRRRGGIFYKAAFYDRNAHFNLKTRYYATHDYAQPISTCYIADEADGSQKHVIGTVDYADYKGRHAMETQAREWLAANLPDYQNPLSYWDAA